MKDNKCYIDLEDYLRDIYIGENEGGDMLYLWDLLKDKVEFVKKSTLVKPFKKIDYVIYGFGEYDCFFDTRENDFLTIKFQNQLFIVKFIGNSNDEKIKVKIYPKDIVLMEQIKKIKDNIQDFLKNINKKEKCLK